MQEDRILDENSFKYLSAQGGLPEDESHAAELLSFVRSILASMKSLRNLDVAGLEPDMKFIPHREEPV